MPRVPFHGRHLPELEPPAWETLNMKSDFTQSADGGLLWHGSLVLLKFLCETRRDILDGTSSLTGRPKRVLELGSGLGDLALGVKRHFPQLDLTATERRFNDTYDRIEARIEKFNATTASASGAVPLKLAELSWGHDGDRASPLWADDAAERTFDVVIAAECVYDEGSHEWLLETLLDFTRVGTVVWFVMVQRPFCFGFFARLDDTKLFDVTIEENVDTLGMSDEAGVTVLRAERISEGPRADRS